LFYKQQYWSLKDLRAKVQQPEAYLKEVLAEIGHLERSGPNNGTWRLQESYAMAAPEAKEEEMEVEGSQGFKMEQPPYKMEYPLEPMQNNMEFDYGEPDDDDEDDEDEDEDEDDMEEVE
jgi:transcription initiation factor TFIIF subunit beta